MGSSSRRSLELKLMGCQGLQAFNFFQKLKVFAVVSLTSDTPGNKHHHPLHQQQQRTKTDAEGDKDPEWNHEMRFDLDAVGREDCDHLYLHIDLRYEFFGDKSIGEVRVPLTDLVCDSTTGLGEHGENCGVARFVSYEVRTHEKKPNGVITFSYKVVNPLHGVGGSATATTTATATATTTTTYGYIDGYTVVTPVDDHHHHSNHDQNTTAAAADYSTVNHVNGDLLHQQQQQQQQQQQNQNQHHHHHHQSDHDQDQHLQSPYGRADQEFSYHYSAVESAAYGIHYPSLKPPPYLPTPAGEGYMSYSRFDHHQFQYPPPPPPFHPPPELTRISSHPFPPPQPPPPELTRISSDPFPPPQPPLHHHHHHHHVAHGAVYPPPTTGGLYEQSYGMSSSIYYNGDGTPRY